MERASAVTGLKVADVNVSIHCMDRVPLLESDPIYTSFFSMDIGSCPDIDIDVSIELDRMPETKRLAKIFDSGQSWSMFHHGDEYVAALSPPAFHARPVWVAQFKREVSKVRVHCGDVLIHEGVDGPALLNPVRYPLDQILLMYFLAGRKGALIHAAAANINGRGYVFLGRSGAGKSTLLRQFFNRDDVRFLSDDRIVIRRTAGTYRAFGTPWPGEAGIAQNESFPLSCLFFLSRGCENELREIGRKEALERLLPVTSIPWYDREIVGDILIFCEDLISLVPTYELRFKPEVEVAHFLANFAQKS